MYNYVQYYATTAMPVPQTAIFETELMLEFI